MSAAVGSVAVAAPHGLAVDAAQEAVEAGGNAIDAALAAAAVLVVSYPHQCALGGDLTALVRGADGRVEAVLSLGAAPAAVDVEALRAQGGRMPARGALAVTVPGIVAGWSELARLGARRGLREPLLRAAELAEAGVPVAPGLSRGLAETAEAVASDPGLRAIFTRGGEPLRTGDTLVQPRLAATLRRLAEDPSDFYRGETAERLVAALRRLGSPVTAEDLAAHAAERPAPLAATVGETRWWAPPPPSQGATALALIAPEVDPDAELLARVRAAQAARARLLGDPRGGPIDVAGLRSPRPLPATDPAPAPRVSGDTVAVAAVDGKGRSVTLIQSVFQTFGAGILEPETGIVLHNRGSSFSLEPGHPAELVGGRRPPHTLCPLLAESADVRLALGCQGGSAQPSILAQVAAAALDPGADLAAALAAPRFVVGSQELGFDTETVLIERGAAMPGLPPLPLVEVGRDSRCGHVQAARAAAAGLDAATDPRADGRAATIGPGPGRGMAP